MEKSLRKLHKERMVPGRHETRGFVRIACIDDDVHIGISKPAVDGGGGVMVPRALSSGGIMGYEDPNDRRYGEGVTRRALNCHMRPIKEEKGYRPDKSEAMEPVEYKLEPPQGTVEELLEGIPYISADKLKESGLDGRFRFMEESIGLEVYEKFKSGRDDDGYEVGLPRELYEQHKHEYRGYPVVYGRAGEISLRHKETGITQKIKLEE